MKLFLRRLWNSSFSIFLLRKPVNTFFPFLLSSNYNQQASKWMQGQHYKTEYYSNLDKKAHDFFEYIFNEIPQSNSVLDICCNQGRFLIGLEKRGFRNLFGVDIMVSAIEILQKYEGADGNKIDGNCDLIQNYLAKCADKSIDYAITYSATIELISPSFDIFKHLARVCRKGFIFAINENGHTYPRFYRYLAEKNGFKKVDIINLGDGINILNYVLR